MTISIRYYRPGDEAAQAVVYNAGARLLPAFKPAGAEEIGRRAYAPNARIFAVDEDRVVGYATFNENGRVGYPWTLPGADEAREALWDHLEQAITESPTGIDPWTTYRADWAPVLDDFRSHDFEVAREAINLVAPTERLLGLGMPTSALAIEPWQRGDVAEVLELGGDAIEETSLAHFFDYYFENRYFSPDCLFLIRDEARILRGFGLAIVNDAYADPRKIDSAMPCFRLGAFGTERQRHKRVNGLISWIAADPEVGRAIVAEAARRLRRAGVDVAAAQAFMPAGSAAPTPEGFERQASFPILKRTARV